MQLQDKKVLVAGLGKSGFAAAVLASSRGALVTVIDSVDNAALQERAEDLKKHSVDCILSYKEGDLAGLKFDLTVTSPGIPPASLVGQVVARQENIYSELGFASALAPWPLYAVTGTNGKTTTVEMACHILGECGKKTIAAGNIGLPLSQVVFEAEDLDAVIVEVSSFQLEERAGLAFEAAVILNISSDHEDRYDSFEHYRDTKMQLCSLTRKKVLINSELKEFVPESCKAEVLTLSRSSDGDFISGTENLVFAQEKLPIRKLKVLGRHNGDNAIAALFLANEAGLRVAQSFTALCSYSPAEHRLQLVENSSGTVVINDSKSTNPDSLLQAINSVRALSKGEIVLIAGGRDKKMDFTIVNSALSSYVSRIYLYGEAKEHLFNTWHRHTNCIICKDFDEAVNLSFGTVGDEDCLLLSPACASLDLFTSYAERGNKFMRLIRNTTK